MNGGTVQWGAADQINNTAALGGISETVGAVSLVNAAISGSGVLTGSAFALQIGAVNTRLAGSGAALTKKGHDTATLNAAAIHTGATEICDGTLLLNGVGLGASAVTLGSGAGTQGTLRVAGDVTLGTATDGCLTIPGGAGGGALSLEDGGINTLTLANSALGSATLSAEGVPGQDARATLGRSNTTTDRITVAGRMAVNAGGLTLGGGESVGGHAAYAWKVGAVLVTPEVRMFWQHETLEGSPWVASRFASAAGGVFRLRGPRLGRDSLVGSVSVTVQLGGSLRALGSMR